MAKKRAPSHPGGILKRLYLEPLNLPVTELAQALGVSRKTVSKVLNERGAITPGMALRLAIAFETTPQVWLNLQQNYDLWVAARKTRGLRKVHKIAA